MIVSISSAVTASLIASNSFISPPLPSSSTSDQCGALGTLSKVYIFCKVAKPSDAVFAFLYRSEPLTKANFVSEFSKVDQIDIENEKKEYLLRAENPSQVMILNFNYTSTIFQYLVEAGQMNVEPNFIHGKLNGGKENKINFGFGDEMDEEYKLIENIVNNEFLKNFKSFQYLQNSN